jgi:hypothetical protein
MQEGETTSQLDSNHVLRLTGTLGGRSTRTGGLPSFSACLSSRRLRRYAWGVQLIIGGGIDPSPTSERSVSGSRLTVSDGSEKSTHKTTGTRTTPQKIVRNQKIALHPRVYENTPPNTGPTRDEPGISRVGIDLLAVLNVPANWKIPTNLPLS